MNRDLSGLSDHLFAQLETLGSPDLDGNELKQELERAKAIASLSSEVIKNGRLILDAKLSVSDLPELTEVPKQLT